MSFMIAMAFVLLWMIFYYGKAGIAADIALIFNIVLIFGVLTSLGAVLTLDGFSNALSSILDANITTGLTAIILFIFGSGPIKGFATTLLIGIVTSLFTAIFITRFQEHKYQFLK